MACYSTNIRGYDDISQTCDKIFNMHRLQEEVSEESLIDHIWEYGYNEKRILEECQYTTLKLKKIEDNLMNVATMYEVDKFLEIEIIMYLDVLVFLFSF